MKRLLLAVILGLVLTMVLGSSVVYAGGPPDSIIIRPGTIGPPRMNAGEHDPGPPPEITIDLPNGRTIHPGPPDDGGGL